MWFVTLPSNYFTNGPAIFILVAWEIAWKGIALWHSARNHQRNWFIAILILNTIGILPIIFLKFFQKK